MDVRSFFLDDRVNLAAGLLALGLFGAGTVALTQRLGIAGIFLLLSGFVVLMFLEYRHVHDAG